MTRGQILLIVTLLLCGIQTVGQSVKYRVADIPLELKKGAYSVVRNSEVTFTRTSLTKSNYKVTEAITILNKKDLDKSWFVQHYDKFSKVRKIKVYIYDEYGELVKKRKLEDIVDVSATGYNLYSDSRVKVVDAEYKEVPFTIEFNYEIDYNGSLFDPDWYIYPGYNTAVQKSSFTVITKDGLDINYHYQNLDISPVVDKIDGDSKILKWKVNNLKAIKNEGFAMPFRNICPAILTQSVDFSFGGYEGNIATWKNLGDWINQLNADRSELSEETNKEIKSMISDSMADSEIISTLYSWMQSRTRYASIQVGIGGWQPFTASEVEENLYGDCKALSNYMKSVLSVAGIDSYYTLVKAGSSSELINTEFPASQFNHVILCVPVESDTIWLECTSQTNPCGYIGRFTDNRYVLVVNEDGGNLVKTYTYTHEDNIKSTNAVVSIDKYGDGKAKVTLLNQGQYYDDFHEIAHTDYKNSREELINELDIPSFELGKFTISEDKSRIPSIEIEMELDLKSFATSMGSRLMFDINPVNKHSVRFKRTKNRKNDIYFRRNMHIIDTIVYEIPVGYTYESIPKNESYDCDFGNYQTSVEHDESTITYIRKLKVNMGSYQPDKYSSLKAFYSFVRKADRQKVVLVKK